MNAFPIVAPVRQRFGDLLWLFPADQAKASQADLNVSVDGIVRRWDIEPLRKMMFEYLTVAQVCPCETMNFLFC